MGSEELKMHLNDLPVASDGGTGLCFGGLQLMHLACGFVYQGEHCREGKPLLLKPTLGHGVAMIYEVTGHDSGYVERLTLLTVGYVDVGSEQ